MSYVLTSDGDIMHLFKLIELTTGINLIACFFFSKCSFRKKKKFKNYFIKGAPGWRSR